MLPALYQEIFISLDEAFAYAENSDELRGIILQIIRQFYADTKTGKADDKKELFREILNYLK